MSPQPLPLAWSARPAAEVAEALIGCRLVRRTPQGDLGGRIVETEAYVGPHDLACHAAKGRTARTEVLFGEAGRAYVYLIYGIHELFNVVTGQPGHGEAVLVRALEPDDPELATHGPGRLTRALDIDRSLYGHPLDRPPLWLEGARAADPKPKIEVGPRIGVDYAGPWAAAPLRFVEAGNPWLSTAPAGARNRRARHSP